MRTPLQGVQQAILAKLLTGRIGGFGDPVGVKHERVSRRKPHFGNLALPFFEQSHHGGGGTQRFHLRRRGDLLPRGEGRERQRARGALVIVQVALAMVLLISSGLMIRTFRALTKVDPGFTAPADVETCRVAIPDTGVKDPERVAAMEREILRKLEAIPGVSSAGASMSVPMDGNPNSNPVYAKDFAGPQSELPLRRFRFISPGFLHTLGTRLIAGRDFTWTEVFNKVPVALVSDLTRRHSRPPSWGNGGPL